jgi:hypothetical protein
MSMRAWVLVAAAGLAAGVAACGGGDDDDLVKPTTTTANEQCKVQGAATTDARPKATVEVQLSEYAIVPEPTTVQAGPTKFVVRNDGHIAHELMIVRYDGDPGGLPLNPVGGADTSKLPDDAVAGWIRQFDPGDACSGTFDLAAGRYVVLCNLVDDATNPHYGQGMRMSFEVS